jgi:excisionase family DNA binding protein
MSPPIDPETLPPVVPLQTAARVLGIGKNQAYRLAHEGCFPVRIMNIGGRFRVSRYDLLAFLNAPGCTQGQEEGVPGGRPLRPVRGAS